MADIRLQTPVPRWARAALIAAAVYNILWGGWVVLFPETAFRLAGMDPPRYSEIWQCVGMIVGVYGVGYAIASRDPFRHWPIVLVGLLGKVFGPIGFVDAALSGALPWTVGWTILTNDLIWWVPFGAVLYRAWCIGRARGAVPEHRFTTDEPSKARPQDRPG